MNSSRDWVVLSTAAVLGALASTSVISFYFFFNGKRKRFPFSSATSNGRRSSSNVVVFNSSSNGSDESREIKAQPLNPFDPSKRKGYLSWDDYFMAIAFLSAERSKDPNRQVGACLVSQNGIILGIGYNGFPRGCSDDMLPWSKKSKNGNPLETKYPYVCHAEVNAILNTNHASAAGQVSSNFEFSLLQFLETLCYYVSMQRMCKDYYPVRCVRSDILCGEEVG
ncbi:uncharacterized protein [Coffea arabica]|uniref:dCMP deaminase n=1 Tax=Coffea arabica TaxID=13443 RepID=A0A6P6U7D1_COFAR